MKTDIYTKVILTVIAICLLFNILKEIEIIPGAKADTNSVVEITPPPVVNTLKANADGSINVKVVTADVIEVKPAYGAEFAVKTSSSTPLDIKPYSGAEFKVQPANYAVFEVKTPYNTSLEVKPAYGTEFAVKTSSSKPLDIKPYSSAEFKVKPVNNAVFTVRQEDGSYINSTENNTKLSIYPNPASNNVTLEYQIDSPQYLTVCNIEGKIMDYILLQPGDNKHSMDITNYPTGTYIYSLAGASGKLIKK